MCLSDTPFRQNLMEVTFKLNNICALFLLLFIVQQLRTCVALAEDPGKFLGLTQCLRTISSNRPILSSALGKQEEHTWYIYI